MLHGTDCQIGAVDHLPAMSRPTLQTGPLDIDSLITTVRGQKVILDADLARVYGAPTKALNQAVKRNGARFPADFLFKLTTEETAALNRSQFVTGSQKHRDPRFAPSAFTEHG